MLSSLYRKIQAALWMPLWLKRIKSVLFLSVYCQTDWSTVTSGTQGCQYIDVLHASYWCTTQKAPSHLMNQTDINSSHHQAITWIMARWLSVILTHWGWDKMAAISQVTLSNAFSSMKMLEFQLKFHWSLSLRVQLMIFQHWFRWLLGTDQVTSHYLNQWLLDYWCIYVPLGLNELIGGQLGWICNRTWKIPAKSITSSELMPWSQDATWKSTVLGSDQWHTPSQSETGPTNGPHMTPNKFVTGLPECCSSFYPGHLTLSQILYWHSQFAGNPTLVWGWFKVQDKKYLLKLIEEAFNQRRKFLIHFLRTSH